MARSNLWRTSSRGGFRFPGRRRELRFGLRTKFESYANSKVRWGIVDELRKVDPMPRRARLRIRDAQRVRSELVQTLGRV